MARIAYSCSGEGRGHSSRTLTIVRALQRLGHEVTVFTSGQAYDYLRQHLPAVHSIPGLFIAYENNEVNVFETVKLNLRTLYDRETVVRDLVKRLEDFAPEFAVTDFEPFLPLAAARMGIPFISVDHQHVIPHLRTDVPAVFWFEFWVTKAIVALMHKGEQANLVTSFYQPDPPHPPATYFFPPILREELSRLKPSNQGHVLVYQTSTSFDQLPEVLKKLPFHFKIHAFNRSGTDGNLTFVPRGTPAFLDDLAGADWVLSNGGYTLISECLHFGKPVFTVPVRGQFEQWLNAHYVQQLGYGVMCQNSEFNAQKIEEFAGRREEFRRNLYGKVFYGNDLMVEKIAGFTPIGTSVRHRASHAEAAVSP